MAAISNAWRAPAHFANTLSTILLAVLMLASTFPSGSFSKDWDGMISRAENAAKGGNHQVAIDLYSEIVLQPFVKKSSDWLAWLFLHRAKSYLALESYGKAIDDLRKVIEFDDQEPLAFYHYGEALFSQGEYDQAINRFDQALKLKPDFIHALTDRGSAYAAIGKIDEGFSSYLRALEIAPTFWQAQFGLAVLYREQKKFQDALKYLNDAIGQRPENSQFYVLRGQVKVDLGRERAGLRDFQTACELGFRPSKYYPMDEATWEELCPSEH